MSDQWVRAMMRMIEDDLRDTAERGLIGAVPLSGVEMWRTRVEDAFDLRMDALGATVPFEWQRELPVATMVRVRPRLRWLHRRRRWRCWAVRRRLLDEYVAIKYEVRYQRPLGVVRVTGVVV